MKIEVGRYAGFCRGVKSAVDGTFSCARELRNGPVFTDGELIHNPQTLQLLDRHNVRSLGEDGVERARGATVVVRAHGVSPQRLRALREVAAEVRNLTCPDVGKVQAIVKRGSRQGRSVVIFGKREHPEVRGLLGFADQGYAVASVEEVEDLPPLERVLLVSQTTMNGHNFERVAERVAERFADVEVVNTICSATELRQNEARDLARRSDCMLVIGGANSSNTRRLYEIAAQHGPAHLIVDVDDVRGLDLTGIERLAVTAGASTPDWLIQDVVEEVRRLNRPAPLRWLHNAVLCVVYSNLLFAGGAFTLSLAVADNLAVQFRLDDGLLVALYYLSMSLLNSYTSRASLRIDDARRYRFMHRYRYLFGALFLLATGAFLGLALSHGPAVVGLTLFSLVLGVAYNISYVPVPDRGRRVLGVRLRDLPALKSLVFSFAVTVLLNGLPLLRAYPHVLTEPATARPVLGGLGLYFSLYYVFMLVFTREALRELKTAQTDRIAGVSSLLTLVRTRYITALLLTLPVALLLAMLGGVAMGVYPVAKLKYFIALGYNGGVVFVARTRRLLAGRFPFELLVESNVYVAGLVALL